MTETSTDSTSSSIRDKILKVLEMYPRISPSMLQIGIGSSLPTAIWRPVFDEMIASGTIVQTDIVSFSSTDRQQLYKIIHLASDVVKAEAAE